MKQKIKKVLVVFKSRIQWQLMDSGIELVKNIYEGQEY